MAYQPLGKWEPAPSPVAAAAVVGLGLLAGAGLAWALTRTGPSRSRPVHLEWHRVEVEEEDDVAEKTRRERAPGTRKSSCTRSTASQVYARKDDAGKPTIVDAIDQDERKIRDIADRLWRRGFGVMRQRNPGPARSSTC